MLCSKNNLRIYHRVFTVPSGTSVGCPQHVCCQCQFLNNSAWLIYIIKILDCICLRDTCPLLKVSVRKTDGNTSSPVSFEYWCLWSSHRLHARRNLRFRLYCKAYGSMGQVMHRKFLLDQYLTFSRTGFAAITVGAISPAPYVPILLSDLFSTMASKANRVTKNEADTDSEKDLTVHGACTLSHMRRKHRSHCCVYYRAQSPHKSLGCLITIEQACFRYDSSNRMGFGDSLTSTFIRKTKNEQHRIKTIHLNRCFAD